MSGRDPGDPKCPGSRKGRLPPPSASLPGHLTTQWRKLLKKSVPGKRAGIPSISRRLTAPWEHSGLFPPLSRNTPQSQRTSLCPSSPREACESTEQKN